MMLFTPQPREPRNYAEFCLSLLLHQRTRPPVTMTDDELRYWLARGPLYGDHGVQGPAYGDHPRFHVMSRTDTLRVWALTEGESEFQALKRAPDFSGASLLNTVRELLGIWKPQ